MNYNLNRIFETWGSYYGSLESLIPITQWLWGTTLIGITLNTMRWCQELTLRIWNANNYGTRLIHLWNEMIRYLWIYTKHNESIITMSVCTLHWFHLIRKCNTMVSLYRKGSSTTINFLSSSPNRIYLLYISSISHYMVK